MTNLEPSEVGRWLAKRQKMLDLATHPGLTRKERNQCQQTAVILADKVKAWLDRPDLIIAMETALDPHPADYPTPFQFAWGDGCPFPVLSDLTKQPVVQLVNQEVESQSERLYRRNQPRVVVAGCNPQDMYVGSAAYL